jgi:hypothetical protein
VVVFRSLRYWLSFVLRRLVFVVLVFLRFPLFLLLVALLCRLLVDLLCRRLRCGLRHSRYFLLLHSRVSVSPSSLVVRRHLLAPTVAGLATLSLLAGRGIPAYARRTLLVVRLALQVLLLLRYLIRTLSVVFVVCSLVQALPRRVLLVLCLALLAPRDHHLPHSQVRHPRGIWILELLFI